MPYQIVCLNNISPKGLKLFNDDIFQLSEDPSKDTKETDAFLVRSAKLHGYKFSERLLAIGRAGSGVNNIPLDVCAEKGIVVFNTPGANANAVKELVLTGLFISSRKIVEGIKYIDTIPHDENFTANIEKSKKLFAGPEIIGKTMGIIGLGAIGNKVAKSVLGLGMKVIGYDPAISVEGAWRIPSEVQKAYSLEYILTQSDYLSLHIPLMDSTRHILNKNTFQIMKKNARIMNFARAELVNSQDLLEAINTNRIGYYVTDFAETSLVGKPNIVCIPHLGASTPEAEDNCAIMAVKQIQDYMLNGNIANSVNFPACSQEWQTKNRITFTNYNIPKVISHVSTLLGEHHINIATMVNKSKNKFAYTIIDTESPLNDDVLTQLRNIEGVIRVRLLKKDN